MANNLQIFERKDFTGGINYSSDQFQLSENESPSLLNIEIDPRGGFFSRGGMNRINSTNISGTWAPQKLFPFNGDAKRIIMTTTTRVYKGSGGNMTTLDFGSGTPIVSAATQGSSCAQWGNTLYISTGRAGTLGGYSWKTGDTYATRVSQSGTTVGADLLWQTTADASQHKMPQCEHLAVHADKMFAANTLETGIDYPNRLRWSIDGTADNWIISDYIDISGGGDGITAIVTVQGQLLIFKPQAIYALIGYDSTNFQIVELSHSIGVKDANSVVASDIGVFFYTNGVGVYYYNGSIIQDVFAKIKPIFDLAYVNFAATGNVSVSWINQRLWLSLPYSESGIAATDITKNFVYNPRFGAWTVIDTADNYGVMGGCEFIDDSNVKYFLMLHPTVPVILSVDDYDYETDSITTYNTPQTFVSYYRTKWYDGGTYMQSKMWKRNDFVARESAVDQDIDISVYRNFDEVNIFKSFTLNQTSTASMLWNINLWNNAINSYFSSWSSSVAGATILAGKNLGLARCVQIQINGPAGTPWGINSLGFKYIPKRVKA